MFQTKQAARAFVGYLKEIRTPKEATVVGLYGNLGAGKTTFTQEVARLMGIKEKVISPTFIIERIYKINKKSPFERLIHIDAYRLENPKELKAIGFQEILKQKTEELLELIRK